MGGDYEDHFWRCPDGDIERVHETPRTNEHIVDTLLVRLSLHMGSAGRSG